MQAAATLAVSAGCELDLLDEQLLSELDTSQLSRPDICAYLADQWAPLIEVLSGDSDQSHETWQTAPDGTTTVITTAGAIGIAWTMSVRH